MSERLEVETPFGPVWLRGRDTGARPAVVALHGLHAPLDGIGKITSTDADVFDAHLPGNHCPELIDKSIGVWAAAYGWAFAERFAGRRLALIGVSTGCLVAMAIRRPAPECMLLIEPPLRPGVVWPLRGFPAQLPEASHDLLWKVFGVATDRHEPRDYIHLLKTLAAPATVLVGSIPLHPVRETPVLPSFVDDQTRAELAAHPLVELRVVEGAGHNVPRDGLAEVDRAFREMVEGRLSLASPRAPRR